MFQSVCTTAIMIFAMRCDTLVIRPFKWATLTQTVEGGGGDMIHSVYRG